MATVGPFATQQMGIGSMSEAQNLIFKRKFRWTFAVSDICGGKYNIGSQYVKVANRPSITFDETEINYLQGKMFIPGKATFETISVTYYDVHQNTDSSILNLYNWIATVYDFLGPQGTVFNPRMSAYANGDGGYGGTGVLTLYDGGGNSLEEWKLSQCWPQSVNFGDLDYSSSDECNIELTLRYTFAKWTNLCNGKQPDPCFVGCK
jgi:hypothetical protein